LPPTLLAERGRAASCFATDNFVPSPLEASTMRLPRVLSAVALAAAMATPSLIPTSRVFAQAPAGTAVPPTNPDAPPPLPGVPAANPLTSGAEDFWHFAKTAKYDLATAAGKRLLDANPNPTELLQAFQGVASERRDDLFETLFKWLNVDPMKDVTQQLIQKLKEGQTGMVTDPKWISDQVQRLAVNERAFEMALANLRNAGEFAAPIMVDTLRDQSKRNLHGATRRALVRLGRQVLNPLVSVLESKDPGTLVTIVGVLGDIGYPDAAPYIARIAATNQPGMEEVKSAAGRALGKLGVDPQQARAADLFLDQGERFYYKNANIVPDQRSPETAHVWFWDDAKGLMNKDVPSQIFSDIMAMRSAEYALKLDQNRPEAVNLWLAANNKREADLPEGKQDPTYTGPNAHFYNVAMGTQYLNAVLARALKDRTAPVALKVVKSLQEIVGQSNMFQGGASQTWGKEPIVAAMQFPDRLVRYESAIAIGSALPQQGFAGAEYVVPTLSEAISSTGRPNVVVVTGDLNTANTIKESLKDSARAEAAGSAPDATAAAGRLPSVDLVVIDTRGNAETDVIIGAPRIASTAKLLIIESKASPLTAREVDNVLINTTVAPAGQMPDAAALAEAINKARTRAGSAAIDEKLAESYAQRAAALLERLAISRGQVLDVGVAANNLMRALDDTRPQIAVSSANVLALINTKESQAAIAAKALDDKTADELKVATFKALAKSAKFWGNQLDPNATDALQKVVETNQNLQVREAAAEAQGALNLPADRAKNLIIQQAQVGK
jgi:hypothetical protein